MGYRLLNLAHSLAKKNNINWKKTMKKTYKNPTLTVVKVQPAQVIAASVPMYGTNATGEGMGRSASFSDWGEDE